MLLPSCISSNPLLMSGSGMACVIIGSISILPSMYQSTIFGTSVRPRAPPKAVPFHTRPVTSWNGRVAISAPAGATPMMMDWPQPRWQASSAWRITVTFAGAVEGVVGAADLVGAALGHVDEVRDQIAADLFRIDEVRHAEALAPLLLAVVDVDADDHVGAGKPQPLDDVEADAAEPEHDALRAGFHLGGIENGADAGGDAAADVTDLVERSVLANLGDRDLGQHREVRECGSAHVMVQLLAVEREARGAVGHDALALRRTDGGAQIGLARQTRRALPAFRRIERNDVIALFHAGDARPHIDDDAGALVAEDGREQSFRIGAGERELVGVTDARGFHLDQHLGGFRPIQIDLRDRERLALLQCDSGAGFHGGFPPRRLDWRELRWNSQRQSSPPAAEPRKRCNGGGGNSLMKIPTHPSQRWRSGARMGSGPRTMRIPISRKNFKYR